MSGHASLPSKPVDASPTRSPERGPDESRPGFSRSGFAPIAHRHEDVAPYYENPPAPPSRGYDATPDRWEGRREFEDRWDGDYDRKRRRSPSPSYSHQRPRKRSPSPSRPHQSHALPDPASIDSLLTFRQFAEWFRASHPQTARADDEDLRRIRSDVESGLLPESVLIEKHGMAKRYERYRKEYTSRQLFTIYLTHRDESWFKERYSPSSESAALRRRVNRQGRVPAVRQYIDELREGKWDDVNFDESEETRAPRDEPEGLDRALGEDSAYDPLRIEVPPRPGQVFVKTVPPSTSRPDLEGVFAAHPGFQWLALSEPSAKKSFHRVGWAQYEEGVDVEEAVKAIDGSKVDNFTFHMGVNRTPIIGRIRVTPPVAGTLHRLEVDAANARDLARRLEDELLEEASPAPEAEGEGAEKEAGAEAETKDSTPGIRERGSDVVADVIARLLARDSLDGDDLDEEQQLRRAKVTLDQYLAYLRNGLSTCYYCVVPTAFPEELQRKCVGHVRAQPEESSASEEKTRGEENGRGEEPKADGEGDLEAHEGDEATRERRDSAAKAEGNGKGRYTYPSKSNEDKWIENLDLRARALIEDDVDVVEYGGRDIEDETKRLTAPSIKQEEQDKYRCKACSKLFRAPEYVIKHVVSKHPETVKDKLDDLAVFNAFVLDPQHIHPSSTTPAAIDDQLPLSTGVLPAFNPTKATQAMFNQAANQPGFNMAMQQQMMMMMHMQMMMQQGGGSGGGVGPSGGPAGPSSSGPKGQTRDAPLGALPPAPPGGEDPRARKGRLSYRDLDEAAGGGDGGLPY
ncbi:hypothetical protein Q8F55_005749 [Vanrija albida]|uniref:C2H2-type domain-containing protein n=1 Tax=Vanrija albida TaxID=181172 RepID=A0ABR3Q2R8_9TREE